jgi:hypothetical protein
MPWSLRPFDDARRQRAIGHRGATVPLIAPAFLQVGRRRRQNWLTADRMRDGRALDSLMLGKIRPRE